jgi:hypothetical protein
MFIPIPTEPYYICVFEPFSDKQHPNKELLTAYQCILVCRFSSFHILEIDKILYQSPRSTYTPPAFYYVKNVMFHKDPNICGAVETSKIMEEPYLCMETVEHLFAPHS